LGVSLKTVQRYELDKTAVDAAFLQAICEKYPDISAAWLLTGKGEMHPPEVETPAPQTQAAMIDEALIARIANGISTVYREENARISPVLLVQETTRVYADLVAHFSPEDRDVGLKGMMIALRRDLRRPLIPGDANSKRLA
jgi:hypothetical protein